jgi:hypothetical protein
MKDYVVMSNGGTVTRTIRATRFTSTAIGEVKFYGEGDTLIAITILGSGDSVQEKETDTK